MTRHKHADVIHAWAEGAEIQSKDNDRWMDTIFPTWHPNNEYRIKPRIVKREGWAILFRDEGGNLTVGPYLYQENELQSVVVEKVAIAKFEWEEEE